MPTSLPALSTAPNFAPASTETVTSSGGDAESAFAAVLADASQRQAGAAPAAATPPVDPSPATEAVTAADRDAENVDGDGDGELNELEQLLAALAGALPALPSPVVTPQVAAPDAPLPVVPFGIELDGPVRGSRATPAAVPPSGALAAGTDLLVGVLGDPTDGSNAPTPWTESPPDSAGDWTDPEGAIDDAAAGGAVSDALDRAETPDSRFEFAAPAARGSAADTFAAPHGGGRSAPDFGASDDASPLATATAGVTAPPTDGVPAPFTERLLQELAGARAPTSVESIATGDAIEPASVPRTMAELPELLGAARDGVVRLQRDGGHWGAEIRLDPAELGAIHVRIESHGGRLQVDARCDDREVERELARLFSQWDDDLRKQGGGASFTFDRKAGGEATRDDAATRAAERSAVRPPPSRAAGGAGTGEARQLDLLA